MTLVRDEDEQCLEAAAAVVPGTVMAWGANGSGQLGNGTTNTSSTPVLVRRLTGATTAAAGADGWSLALLADGTLRAWGKNDGLLGDGTTPDRLVPVPVPGLSRVTALAAGGAQSLALLADGTVMSWGDNTFGELGDGSDVGFRGTPGPVRELGAIRATAVASGGDHSLALLADGTVRGWGRNESGQLGDGTFTESNRLPVRVRSLRQVKAVTAGFDHSLALLADGTVRAWGSNADGQLGGGTTGDAPPGPVAVRGLTGVTAVAAGHDFSLALVADGTVWAWGGLLGDGTTNSSSLPVRVPGLTGVTAVAAGRGYGLALVSDGTVRAWGGNFSGNLGDGTTVDRTRPVRVRNLTGVIGLSGGFHHSLAVQ